MLKSHRYWVKHIFSSLSTFLSLCFCLFLFSFYSSFPFHLYITILGTCFVDYRSPPHHPTPRHLLQECRFSDKLQEAQHRRNSCEQKATNIRTNCFPSSSRFPFPFRFKQFPFIGNHFTLVCVQRVHDERRFPIRTGCRLTYFPF
jgi:hypothetical protein